ncbi:precorrin-3B C(17)-methyltransferase [Paenibacillus illinoisensis]|uniref:Cobalt-precorrin-3B C-methyltransferase Cobalt-precorrin-3 methyltransferase n=1 Tax=Paenibacillus illinoisensis TaxID=59845 RepID=A0A2W0CB75_9BACL|nr:precorrin-3B C(17)-methyltransferase [Paenibacillus illinoisensis]PYY29417.1 Cobalt-precorrin-3B C-methyltransferase Cobalt-precorrin-3 methyltransferase [Paenibacillus illinoisensis]
MQSQGKLLIIGFGPGAMEHITTRALEALRESEVIIGYNTYVDLIRPLLDGQEIVRTGMTEEVSRAQEAVRQAEMGKSVAVISSGDAGVYGMAGLVYEVLMEQGWKPKTGVGVEVIPGVSAIQSCASLLGAPVMHDACTISLSDHLTPWETIIRRVEAAASADFVIALYNPRSGRRTRQIVETQEMLLRYRSPQTPVGLVKSAYRERQDVVMTTLEDMLNHDIGMLTTVIIGNSSTMMYEGLMVTPRGYQRKYTLNTVEQPLRPHERLRTEAEPWSLGAMEARSAASADAASAARDTQIAQPAAEPALRGASASTGMGPQGQQGAGLPAAQPASGSTAVLAAERPAAVEGAPRAALAVPHAGPAELAAEALTRLAAGGKLAGEAASRWLDAAGSGVPAGTQAAGAAAVRTAPEPGRKAPLFEIGVSPGVGNKKFTAAQMALLAQCASEEGELEYTPEHQIILRVPTFEPDQLVEELRAANFIVVPIGDVIKVKACDFCNMEKDDAVPMANHLQAVIGGLSAPKETSVALNGCGMACYGAVLEDIGIVYRKGGYDLFLGGKKFGRNAHPAQPVAEGIPGDQIGGIVERIVAEYKEKGHPNERFHKFFKRVGVIQGFRHVDAPVTVEVNPVCGD